MMRFGKQQSPVAGILFLLVVVSLPSGSAAQDSLDASLAMEERLLDAEVTRYRDARKLERESFLELDRLGSELDQAFGSAKTIAELWKLHELLARVREEVLARTQAVTSRRAQLLSAMERVSELRAEIETQQAQRLSSRHPAAGLWRLALEPISLGGWLSLAFEGTLITGNYRLDSGQNGSVAGTLSGRQIRLQRYDSQAGFDATLEGEYDAELDEVRGVWQGTEVSAGVSTGSWSTTREQQLEAEDVLGTSASDG